MSDDDAGGSRRRLPRYIRFARSLALVSGLAGLGIAIGVTTFTATGCEGCTGICGDFPPATPPVDAGARADHFGDGQVVDGAAADGSDVDAGGGGGPLPAPAFPAAWLA